MDTIRSGSEQTSVSDPANLFSLTGSGQHHRPFHTGPWRLQGVTRNLSHTAKEFENEAIRYLKTANITELPWLDSQGETSWGPLRCAIGRVMLSRRTDMVVAFIILINCALIVWETDKEAQCYPKFKDDLAACSTAAVNQTWLMVANNSLLALYTIEALLNIFVLRSAYFMQRTRIFDFIVCAVGWMSLALGSIINVSWLRILRCGRILKALRFVSDIHELYMLFTGFTGAMKAMFYGALILLGLLAFFSILLVQLVHPINVELPYTGCDRCSRGFRSISESMLTLFQQIVAGDSWGTISVPVIEENFVGLLLPFAQLVIGVGAMNLILSVVVDCAIEAREAKGAELVVERAETQLNRKREFLSFVREMDMNGDGLLDRDEILRAAKNSKDFQTRLHLVGVSADELEQIVDAIEDTAGVITYKEFCNALDDIEASDTRKTAVLSKMNLKHMKRLFMDKLSSQELVLRNIQRQILDGGSHAVPGVASSRTVSNQPHASTHQRHAQLHCTFSVGEQSTITASPRASLDSYFVQSLSEFDISSNNVQDVAMKHEPQPSQEIVVFKDLIERCEARINCEVGRLQRSQAELDGCWTNALNIFQLAVMQCLDATLPLAKQAGAEKPLLPFCNSVVEQLSQAFRTSFSRRSKLFKDVMTEVEEELASVVRSCKVFATPQFCGDELPLEQHNIPVSPRGVEPGRVRSDQPRNLLQDPRTPVGSPRLPQQEH